jgi:hypothetical protein
LLEQAFDKNLKAYGKRKDESSLALIVNIGRLNERGTGKCPGTFQFFSNRARRVEMGGNWELGRLST